MNPKKAIIYKEGIAEELGIEEEVVSDFINFYYTRVRESLSDIEHTGLYLNDLGTFFIRRNKLLYNLKKQQGILENSKKTTYLGYQKSLTASEKIELYEDALRRVNERIEKKKQFKNRKNGLE
tara:strand:- start:65629 stop:65997 length:369 start_codon:yes stop_codon:yes gene_type:complete